MSVLCEAETLYFAVRGFLRFLVTGNRWELVPVSGHVFDDADGRCLRCGRHE